MADKNTFCTHWFLIKLKNVTINKIQFITFGTDSRGGLISGELIVYSLISGFAVCYRTSHHHS